MKIIGQSRGYTPIPIEGIDGLPYNFGKAKIQAMTKEKYLFAEVSIVSSLVTALVSHKTA
jgi:hypothetical protein